MIFLRSLCQFYASLWSAYIDRDLIPEPLEQPWHDGNPY